MRGGRVGNIREKMHGQAFERKTQMEKVLGLLERNG